MARGKRREYLCIPLPNRANANFSCPKNEARSSKREQTVASCSGDFDGSLHMMLTLFRY